jgi:hypothetical protein
MARATKTVMARNRVMVRVARAMVMATKVSGNKDGNCEGTKVDGDRDKEGNGNINNTGNGNSNNNG